jgi:N-acetylglutamate synthase-like GNAT family acetyltransferase
MDPNNEVLIFLQNNRLLGGIVIRCKTRQLACIEYLGVSRNHRGKGLGALLLKVLKRLLQSRRVCLISAQSSEDSQEFYRKQGFITGTYREIRRSHSQKSFLNAVEMQCKIHPKANYFEGKDCWRRVRKGMMPSTSSLYFKEESVPFSRNLLED